MKKKFLCLCVGVTMVGGLLAGCSSKELRPATYSELKTATEDAYKDFTSGNIVLTVNADITTGEDTVKGEANFDIKVDKDTAYVKIDMDGFEGTGLVLDTAELYLDLENKLAYGNVGDGWIVTEDASLEDLLGGFGVSTDTEKVPEIDIKEEDIKVEITDNGYMIKKSYTGSELMDMMDSDEDDSLVMFAAIIEGLSFDIEAEFNTDKVLNDIDFIVKANSIDLGDDTKLDGTLGICAKIADINKCDVSVPQEVIDSAELNEDDGTNGSQFDIEVEE